MNGVAVEHNISSECDDGSRMIIFMLILLVSGGAFGDLLRERRRRPRSGSTVRGNEILWCK
jgi:hypothetical protein